MKQFVLFAFLCLFFPLSLSNMFPSVPILTYLNITYNNVSQGDFDSMMLNSTSLTEALIQLMSDPNYGEFFQNAGVNSAIQTLVYADVNVQNCPQGSFSTLGATSCTFCSPGTFAIAGNATTNTVCVSCAAGKYSSTTGATSIDACLACPVNTWSSTSGAPSLNTCQSCPANSFSSAGTSEQAQCVCLNGFYRDAHGNCTACPANSFCAGNVINSCPENSISPARSSSINDCQCRPSYYGSGDIGVCSLCLPNSYCPGAQKTPTPCPIYSSSPPGSVSLSDCKCMLGYKQSNFATMQRNFVVNMSSCNCTMDTLCAGCSGDCQKDAVCGNPCDTLVSPTSCTLPTETDSNLTCPQGHVQMFYANGYGNNKRQNWWIMPRNRFEIINLTFSMLNVHPSDLLRVSACTSFTQCNDLNNNIRLVDFTQNRRSYVANTGLMKIEWRTDGSLYSTGWKASYTTSTVAQCPAPVISKDTGEIVTSPLFVWNGDTVNIVSAWNTPLAIRNTLFEPNPQFPPATTLTVTVSPNSFLVLDPYLPTRNFQVITLPNDPQTFTISTFVSGSTFSCGTLYLTMDDVLYLTSNVSVVLLKADGVTALDTTSSLRGQRTQRLSWDTSAALPGKYFLSAVIGSSRVEVYIAARPGGMTCQLCMTGEVCFMGSTMSCPPYSTAPPGAIDMSQCVCNSGYYTEKTNMKAYAKSQTIDTSGTHSCAVLGTGDRLHCFGSNSKGQIAMTWSNVLMVSTGSDFTCVLLADSLKIKCFGGNYYGQLGHDSTVSNTIDLADVPITDLGTGYQATQVSCQGFSCCAVVNVGGQTGQVKCWGDGSRGQLGQAAITIGRGPNTMGDALIVLSIPEPITLVTHGGTHVCAVAVSGNVFCWGDNLYGQLGLGIVTPSVNTPTQVDIAGIAETVNCHTGVCCAVMANTGRVKCWGQAAFDRLPHGVTSNIGSSVDTIGISIPIANHLQGAALDVSVGAQQVCVLLNTQRISCWGTNVVDQSTSLFAIQLRGGGNMQCAVLNSYSLTCWGGDTPFIPLQDTVKKSSVVATQKTCSICPENSYCDSSDNGDAIATCPPDSKSDSFSISFSSCLCVDGYFMNAQKQCQLCPAGRYCHGNVQYTCPANSTSASGAATLQACMCDSGFGGVAGNGGCVPCQGGYYKDFSGNSPCLMCPAGSASNTTANANTSMCKACPAGSFSFAGSLACQLCPAGHNSSGNAASCSVCPAGSYSVPGSSVCTHCPAGTYQPPGVSGDIQSCVPCGGGKYSTSVGAADSSVCTLCPEGQFSLSGSTTCTHCPSNTYSVSGGICTPCPNNSTSVAGSGPSQCLCALGLFRSNISQCSPCAAGTFGRDGKVCELCPAGTHQPKTHQGDPSSCIACSVGHFSPVTGSSACTGCSAGTFANSTSATVCTQCNTGFYASANSRQCWPCMTGTYSKQGPIGSQNECTDCPPGYYCGGGADLRSCPLGTFSPQPKRALIAQCLDCPANSFCPLPYLRNDCPRGTQSKPRTTDMLGCLCSYGVSCTYTKVVNAVVNLNITAVYFKNPDAQQQFIQAVAKAAKTDPRNVFLTKIIDVDSGAPITVTANGFNRRLFEITATKGSGVHVFVKIHHADGLEELDKHLLGHGFKSCHDYAWYAPHHVEAKTM